MNLFQIDFEQLYRRHLCRHGHFGINVLHLVAVAGIYIALFGIVANMSALAGLQQHSVITLLILLSPWFTTVAFNVPLRIAFFTGLFVGILLAIYSALPMIPTWAWLIVVFAMHRFQQYSHQLYHMHRDMTAFDGTYPKGLGRFVLLLV